MVQEVCTLALKIWLEIIKCPVPVLSPQSIKFAVWHVVCPFSDIVSVAFFHCHLELLRC
jgi:hypothetical protein